VAEGTGFVAFDGEGFVVEQERSQPDLVGGLIVLGGRGGLKRFEVRGLVAIDARLNVRDLGLRGGGEGGLLRFVVGGSDDVRVDRDGGEDAADNQ
jgi:hypothetical protein